MSRHVEQGGDGVRLAETVHNFIFIADSQLLKTDSFRIKGVNQGTAKGVPHILLILAGHVWIMTSKDVTRNTFQVHCEFHAAFESGGLNFSIHL